MELNRDAAKGAIVNREPSDPELSETLTGAHQYLLGLEKEKHRHAEAMGGVFRACRHLGDSQIGKSMIHEGPS